MILLSDSVVIFYVLSNNFFYTQLASAYVPDDTVTFPCFISSVKF